MEEEKPFETSPLCLTVNESSPEPVNGTSSSTSSDVSPSPRLCIKSSPRSSVDAAQRRQHLESALHDVTSQNISIRKAAIRYGLSKSSLCDFVRKNGIVIPNRRGRRSVAALPPVTVNSSAEEDSAAKHSLIPDDLEAPKTKRFRQSSPMSRGGRARRGRPASVCVRGAPRAIAPKSILCESPWNSGGFPTQVAMSSWRTTVLPVFPSPSDDSIDSPYMQCNNSPEHILLPPPSLPSVLSPLSTGEDDIRLEEKIAKSEVHQVKAMTNIDHSDGLMRFIDSSPSPYHAVHSVRQRLTSNGFTELSEQEAWNVEQGKCYFVTKNQSTVIAFAVGGKWKPGNGFSMVGAHTDSPCLKVKPVSDRCTSGYVQLGVELYGGGIWYTWFDRDLTVAGRVILRTPQGLQHRLVHIKRPIVRVPSLCIHLNRTVNDSFAVNKEQHMSPIVCTMETEKALGLRSEGDKNATSKHVPSMLQLLSKELNVPISDIVDMELCLTDTQPSSRVGVHEEFICGPRMDNLFNAFAATEGLVAALDSLGDDTNIRVACLYDNEEVGSESAQGAASAFTEHVLRRLSNSEVPNTFELAMAKSYMLSADQGHAIHPNYEEKHERNHKPMFNKGMILKINANQRYASTAITAAIVKEVAREANVPLQEFVVRQDVACGSTIGPIQSARLGVATMDIGGPTLSMHSIREMVCAKSVSQAVSLYTAFYQRYPGLAAGFHVRHE